MYISFSKRSIVIELPVKLVLEFRQNPYNRGCSMTGSKKKSLNIRILSL